MEFAPAKINLTLHVTGRREDGFHLLDSLVVFADVGDYVWVADAGKPRLEIDGPEAAGLVDEGDNLVLRAAHLLAPTRSIALKLQKNLPTSSGIGGGSADAAATLRLLARHWALPLPAVPDVLQLGADVPVCLASKPARMQGIGEAISNVPKLPELTLLLVNPRQSVSTPKVFKSIENRSNPPMISVPNCTQFEVLCDWLSEQRNDLQEPATLVAPVISDVLFSIAQTGARVSRMSGSGATCFGLFPDMSSAQDAAEIVSQKNPDWWVKPARVLC